MLGTGKIIAEPVAILSYLVAMSLEYFFCYACIETSVFTSGNVKYRDKKETTK